MDITDTRCVLLCTYAFRELQAVTGRVLRHRACVVRAVVTRLVEYGVERQRGVAPALRVPPIAVHVSERLLYLVAYMRRNCTAIALEFELGSRVNYGTDFNTSVLRQVDHGAPVHWPLRAAPTMAPVRLGSVKVALVCVASTGRNHVRRLYIVNIVYIVCIVCINMYISSYYPA